MKSNATDWCILSPLSLLLLLFLKNSFFLISIESYIKSGYSCFILLKLLGVCCLMRGDSSKAVSNNSKFKSFFCYCVYIRGITGNPKSNKSPVWITSSTNFPGFKLALRFFSIDSSNISRDSSFIVAKSKLFFSLSIWDFYSKTESRWVRWLELLSIDYSEFIFFVSPSFGSISSSSNSTRDRL